MAQVLQSISPLFPEQAYPDLMVGLTVSDDAAVYKITDDIAVIQTLDFFLLQLWMTRMTLAP